MESAAPVETSTSPGQSKQIKVNSSGGTAPSAVENRPTSLPDPLPQTPSNTVSLPAAPSTSSPHRPKTPKLTIQLSSQDGDTIDTAIKDTPPGAFGNLKKEKKGKKHDPDPETILEAVRGDGPADLANDVGKLKKLGKGAGGTVYLGCFVPTLKLIAIKEVLLFHEEDVHMVTHELHALHDNLVPLEDAATHKSIQFLGKLFHRKLHIGNVHACRDMVSFYGAYATPNKSSVSIAMEYMNAGTLQDFVDAKTALSEPILKHIAFCTMRGLHHMQYYHMLHRDIKPANILMNSQGDFKIADFGLAATLSKSKSYFSEFQGTLMYMSPERITGQTYSYPSDIWSMGIVLLSLARGSYPFATGDGFFGLEDAIVNDEMPPVPSSYSVEFQEFVKGLLAKDPEKRLSAFQAMDHPFLYNYNPDNKEFAAAWSTLHLTKPLAQEDLETMVQTIMDQERNSEFDEYDFHPDHLLHHPPDSSTYQLSFKHLSHLADACGTTTDALLDCFRKVYANRAHANTN